MAKEPPKFTEEEEHQIDMHAEANYRARRRIEDDKHKEQCELGNHVFGSDGKCRYCQAPKPAEEPPKKKSGFPNW